MYENIFILPCNVLPLEHLAHFAFEHLLGSALDRLVYRVWVHVSRRNTPSHITEIPVRVPNELLAEIDDVTSPGTTRSEWFRDAARAHLNDETEAATETDEKAQNGDAWDDSPFSPGGGATL